MSGAYWRFEKPSVRGVVLRTLCCKIFSFHDVTRYFALFERKRKRHNSRQRLLRNSQHCALRAGLPVKCGFSCTVHNANPHLWSCPQMVFYDGGSALMQYSVLYFNYQSTTLSAHSRPFMFLWSCTPARLYPCPRGTHTEIYIAHQHVIGPIPESNQSTKTTS